MKIAHGDGAVLVFGSGRIYKTDVYLRGIDPQRILGTTRKSKQAPGAETAHLLGFRDEHVGTRHMTAIGASYQMKGSVIVTLSEETANIRVFYKGRIIFSTMPEEYEQKT